MTSNVVAEPLELIVGIGNPGSQYADTRHNAGVWFVEALAQGAAFKPEKKFFGRTANVRIADRDVKLLIPDTYMNESGKSVAAYAGFFKIPPEQILIAHDEIDFPIGKVRFKQGGGLAGHNGLKDISRRMSGTTAFNRLRLGVGRPGVGKESGVTGHVLGRASPDDRQAIETCIDAARSALPLAITGDWQAAVQKLNTTPQPFQDKPVE